MSGTGYRNLHGHTTFSFLDGYGTPEQVCSRVRELGHDCVAVTDHGNTFAHVPMQKAAREAGVRPIFGCEFYVCDDMRARVRGAPGAGASSFPHVTVVAATQEGYSNLLRLHNASWQEGFYYKPRIDWEELFRRQEGLAVLSGCVGGYPSRIALERGPEACRDFLLWAGQRIERFFVELVPQPGLDKSHAATPVLVACARDLGLPMVMTADAHFPRPGDWEAEDLLLAIGMGDHVYSAQRKLQLPRYQYYCGEEDLLKRAVETAPDVPREVFVEALENAGAVARECRAEVPRARPVTYAGLAPGEDAPSVLWRDVAAGARARGVWGDPEYRTRAEREFRLLREKGFCDYLLAIADVVLWARRAGGLVVLRGSAGGCLLLWLLGASVTDPIRHGLSFERFYDHTRADPPDVDVDFEQSIRDSAIQYVYDRYGRDRCSQVAALGRLKAKAALQDTARAMGVPRHEFAPLAAALDSQDMDVDAQLSHVVDQQALDVLRRHPRLRAFEAIVGQYRNSSTHACGVLVSSDPLEGVVGVVLDKDKNPVAAVDKKGAAQLGLLKMDFLSVRGLDVVAKTVRRIGRPMSWLEGLPLDDRDALSVARRGMLAGVFQLDGASAARTSATIGVDSFEDVYAAGALCRPGPTEWQPTYAGHKGDGASLERYLSAMHPTAADVVRRTFGVLLYQEQVMDLARLLAGLDWPDVHRLRKGVQDKLGLDPQTGPAWEAEWREKFVGGCLRSGVSAPEAEFWWASIRTHGGYSFNKCIAGDTIVTRGASGRYGGGDITVAELWAAQQSDTPVGKKIRAGRLSLLQMDADGRVRPGRLARVHRQGLQDTLLVRTASGRSIRVTANHRLLTGRGWVQAGDLTPGDELAAIGAREGYVKVGARSTATGGSYEGKGFKDEEANPAYIDGRRKAHRLATETVRERTGEACEACGKAYDGSRFEFAHVSTLEECDRDYSLYHNAANILWLCNGCHKRLDYMKGERPGRWVRGRPVEADLVASVEPAGRCETYDIEMNTPGHNFIANEIVSHNSHCVTYGLVGYWMLYLKAHYPAEFYESYLQVEPNDLTVKRLVWEFQSLGGEVRFLCPRESRETFRSPEPWVLVGGYVNLKGMGPAGAEKLAAGAPYESWDHLLSAMGGATAWRLMEVGVLETEMDPQALVRLAPWYPVDRTGPAEQLDRDRWGCGRIVDLVWGEPSRDDVVLAGYVTHETKDRDKLIFALEDEGGTVVARVPYRLVPEVGTKFRALVVSDYVAARGWWAGDVFYMKDVVVMKRAEGAGAAPAKRRAISAEAPPLPPLGGS